MKPGITCYWQTRRNRDTITFNEWVDLDLWDSDDKRDPKAIEKMVRSLPPANGVAVCAIRRVLPDGSRHDLFTCKHHVVEPDAAVGEWLGGGSLRVPTRSLCQDDCSSITTSGSRRG